MKMLRIFHQCVNFVDLYQIEKEQLTRGARTILKYYFYSFIECKSFKHVFTVDNAFYVKHIFSNVRP